MYVLTQTFDRALGMSPITSTHDTLSAARDSVTETALYWTSMVGAEIPADTDVTLAADDLGTTWFLTFNYPDTVQVDVFTIAEVTAP